MSLVSHLDILKDSLAKKKERVKLLDGPCKNKLQNIINRNELNIKHLQEKADRKKVIKESKRNKRRVPSKGGFTRFFKEDEKQKEFESLQIQAIIYFNKDTVPWED